MAEEKIARAAIKFGDEVWSVENPGRHHTLAHAYWKMHGHEKAMEEEERSVQGFVTTTGRFVDRKEAITIAVGSGQIEKPKWPPSLYSEDLW